MAPTGELNRSLWCSTRKTERRASCDRKKDEPSRIEQANMQSGSANFSAVKVPMQNKPCKPGSTQYYEECDDKTEPPSAMTDTFIPVGGLALVASDVLAATLLASAVTIVSASAPAAAIPTAKTILLILSFFEAVVAIMVEVMALLHSVSISELAQDFASCTRESSRTSRDHLQMPVAGEANRAKDVIAIGGHAGGRGGDTKFRSSATAVGPPVAPASLPLSRTSDALAHSSRLGCAKRPALLILMLSSLGVPVTASTCDATQVHVTGDDSGDFPRPKITTYAPIFGTTQPVGRTFRLEHLASLDMRPKSCSAGHSHTACVLVTGGVVTFGRGSEGQLGHGDTAEKLVPTKIAGLGGVRSCSAGGYHTVCVLDTGGVVTFGNGDKGQLGHGDKEEKLVPTEIAGLGGVRSCSAAHYHTACVLETGGVVTFGRGRSGQLGHGDIAEKLVPTLINTTKLSSVRSCSTGSEWKGLSHTVCVLETGGVVTFGDAQDGRLGRSTTAIPTAISVPAAISDLDGVRSCSAGGYHTVCVLDTGGVVTFGMGDKGQLGHGDGPGDKTVKSSPTAVPDLGGVLSCSAGGYYTACVLDTGGVVTFGSSSTGSSSDGQLGHGDKAVKWSPTVIMSLGGVRSCSAGESHAACVLGTGGVVTFGQGTFGQLGHGDKANKLVPTLINTTKLSSVRSCSAGLSHTVCVLDTGGVVTFGQGLSGQLGHGDKNDSLVPTLINTTKLNSVRSCSVGGFNSGLSHTVCVLETGGVVTFGRGDDGELGHGDTADKLVPTKIAGLGGVKSCSAGGYHTVCVLDTGGVVTFGGNNYGQLGHGDKEEKLVPTSIAGLGGVRSCSAANFHTACVLETGGVVTFGRGSSGQLGHGNTDDKLVPTEIAGLGGVRSCSAGGEHFGESHTACVLDTGGVVTFGQGSSGQLGHGDTAEKLLPANVSGFGLASSISAGGSFTIALNCGRPGVRSSTVGAPVACSPGTYLDSFAGPVSCEVCPIGRYSNFTGLAYSLTAPSITQGCTACPGESSNVPGRQMLRSQCDCLDGMEVNETQADACVCPKGRFVETLDSGRRICVACTPGSYQTRQNLKPACNACDVGMFQTEVEQMSCAMCPAGRYQENTGKEFCALCNVGFYTSAENASSAEDCKPCVAGRYASTAGSTESECFACAAGQHQPAEGSSSCIGCAAGRFESSAASLSSVCEECPGGKYQDDSSQAFCKSCSGGTRKRNSTSCAVCLAGHFSGAESDACEECAMGQYADKGALSRCILCPSGYAQGSAAQTECTSCGAGKSSVEGSMSCSDCGAGTYFEDKDHDGDCHSCETGQYQPNAIAPGACTVCPAGKYQTQKGQAFCSSCPAGKHQPDSNTTSCLSCGAGNYSGAEASVCAKCGSGTVPADGRSKCRSCAVGRFSRESAEGETCAECPAGNVTDTLSRVGGSSCTACEAGRWSATAGVACTGCGVGRYLETEGATSASECKPCAAGRYVSTLGSASESACFACAAGQHQPAEGSSSCIGCAAGRFESSAASLSSVCEECPGGKYQAKPKQAFCDTIAQCEPGRFVANASEKGEHGRCGDCPQHYYQQTMDQSSCEACPDGKYQNKNGSFYCDETKSDSVLRPSFQNGVQILVDWECPAVAMECNGLEKTYRSGVWHNPEVDYPDQDMIYMCVNEGCPDEGDTKMRCKVGYTGPLCALCDDGYFASMRECVECKEPQYGLLAAFCSVLALFVAGFAYAFQKFNRYLSPTLMTHFKILVAFITIMATIDTEFGVQWPHQFLAVVSFLSAFAFDPTAIAHGLCLFDVSFYDDLVFSTAGLIVALVAIGIAYFTHPKRKATCLKTAIYLLVFAYPLVSVRVVRIFGCHSVKYSHDRTDYYLRADYNLKCYDARWTNMAIYASSFLVVYVVGLPLFMLVTLLRYQRLLGGRKAPPDSWLLGFLLDDYKLVMPAILWEFCEIVRKLSLSVVGSFWSDQSPMAIATALLISAVFLLMQHHYRPFKNPLCNFIQQMEMQCLCLAYFAGLLIKVNVAETSDKAALGYLLATTVVLMVFSVLGAAVVHVYGVVKNIRIAQHMGSVLKTLPRQDPPDNSDEFYLIQIPVEEVKLGATFEPKLPEKLSHVPAVQKLAVVHALSDSNEKLLHAFFGKLESSWTTPLRRVQQAHEVSDFGTICVKCSRKSDESILAKALRPSILAKNPRFSVEHIRDTFRFKAVVYSFRDALRFVWEMDQDRSLCRRGLSPSSVAKLDLVKLRQPKEWGWYSERFLAFDFIMPNYQIVECYIVFTEMEAAKKNDDPTAAICAQLSNHEIFEKWRVVDTSSLQGERREEFQQDVRESNRRYDSAFADVLSHTSQAEWVTFWSSFGEEGSLAEHLSDDEWRLMKRLSLGLDDLSERTESVHTNPMREAIERERRIKKRLSLGLGEGKGETDDDVTEKASNPMHESTHAALRNVSTMEEETQDL